MSLLGPLAKQVLSKLQRRIRQHGWRQTEETLKRNFGADCLTDVFADFEREPIGSGCCAQVYRATLAQYDGVEVAVKVLHPNVESRSVAIVCTVLYRVRQKGMAVCQATARQSQEEN